jgi:ribonuclease III
MPRDLNLLCERLGYSFKKIALLDQALKHRSLSSDNNERLEFLGDAIVNFVIAEEMYHRCGRAREGELSRLRASLVKGEALAEVAKELEVGEYLLLGPGELKSGGQERASILADAMEAIIAAIYLDSDINTCRQCVLSWFESRLDVSELKKDLKDPKTRLQEYLQAKQYPLPTYNIKEVIGDPHAQTFLIECRAEGLDITTTAEGSSRRRAEQKAAEKFLEALTDNGKGASWK